MQYGTRLEGAIQKSLFHECLVQMLQEFQNRQYLWKVLDERLREVLIWVTCVIKIFVEHDGSYSAVAVVDADQR
jgi:hypothetical protein